MSNETTSKGTTSNGTTSNWTTSNGTMSKGTRRNRTTQQENLLRFPLLLLKRRTPFIHRKWRILLISSFCRVNQKRNSGGIPFEESSAVTPQVEYSFLPPKTDGSPHFLLLWRILLVPSVWGEFSKRGAPSEFLLRRANHVTWGRLGSSKYHHKRSLELKVKFNYKQKIKLILF